MMQPLTRRQAIATSAGLATSLLTATTSGSLPISSKGVSPTVGIATFRFPELTNAQMAEAIAQAKIPLVQLFLSQADSSFWRYNSRSDLSELTADRCKTIANTYRQAGLQLHSLGVYTNLIHPDPAERQANLDYFEAMMRIARQMDVKMLVTEAGHYEPPEPAPRVAYHFQTEVWDRTVATCKQLAELAQKHDVVVLLEPFFRGFLASAKRTRLFLEAVNSPHIRALLDPANLLEVNDLDEMFAQLSPWIDCLHAKDRKLHIDRGVAAGQGDLDYQQFVRLASQQTPHAPLVMEYVGAADYLQALKHLRHIIREVNS